MALGVLRCRVWLLAAGSSETMNTMGGSDFPTVQFGEYGEAPGFDFSGGFEGAGGFEGETRFNMGGESIKLSSLQTAVANEAASAVQHREGEGLNEEEEENHTGDRVTLGGLGMGYGGFATLSEEVADPFAVGGGMTVDMSNASSKKLHINLVVIGH
ncbi:hypothetical protein KIPB_008275, partial [Kipferlia bialata]|eukprot:g8275.t1